MSDQRKAAIKQHLGSVFTSIPFNKLLGLQLTQLDATEAAMSFDMKDELIGNYVQGILHGGVISSVLDMVGGILVMGSVIDKHPEATLDEMRVLLGKCSTIDLQVSYLRPGNGEHFTAKSWLLKSGQSISFTRMELYNQTEDIIATASGTYRA